MRVLLIAVATIVLVGCGKFYWGKPGTTLATTLADFSGDHRECVSKVALTSASKEYGMVPKDLYRACMKGRGWKREQHVAPVPAGWFRGIEDEDVVRIDTLPEQPGRAPR